METKSKSSVLWVVDVNNFYELLKKDVIIQNQFINIGWFRIITNQFRKKGVLLCSKKIS